MMPQGLSHDLSIPIEPIAHQLITRLYVRFCRTKFAWPGGRSWQDMYIRLYLGSFGLQYYFVNCNLSELREVRLSQRLCSILAPICINLFPTTAIKSLVVLDNTRLWLKDVPKGIRLCAWADTICPTVFLLQGGFQCTLPFS